MLERELKVVVDPGFVVPELGDAIAGASLGEPERRHIDDVYFDTADLRLARWGSTVRHRRGVGWTVKTPRPSRGAMLDRDEVVFDGAAGQPPAPVKALVASFSRGAALVEVARLSNDRLVRAWTDATGAPVAEFADDRVVGTTTDGDTVTMRELEVELDPSTDKTVLDAVSALLSPATAQDPSPKLTRVLGAAAAAPPDVVVPPLPDEPTAAQVIHAALASSVLRLVCHVPGARLGADPEGVHQARVATRRLRSDLQTFEPLIDLKWARGLRRELKWLADELGSVRDADVLDKLLRATLADHDEIDPGAASALLQALGSQRERVRARLLSHLADHRAMALFDHLVMMARSPKTLEEADRRAQDLLPGLVHKRWRRLQRAVKALPAQPTASELHAVRMLTKRARYAADAVTPAIGKKAAKYAKAAGAIQAELGDLNDTAVAGRWLEAVAVRLPGAPAFAAGQLAHQIADDARPVDGRWRHAYGRMERHSSWLE